MGLGDGWDRGGGGVSLKVMEGNEGFWGEQKGLVGEEEGEELVESMDEFGMPWCFNVSAHFCKLT